MLQRVICVDERWQVSEATPRPRLGNSYDVQEICGAYFRLVAYPGKLWGAEGFLLCSEIDGVEVLKERRAGL